MSVRNVDVARWGLLVATLAAGAAGAGCLLPREATFVCRYEYAFEDGTVDTGIYSEETLSCREYKSSGDQQAYSSQEGCKLAGEELGATEVWCTCNFVEITRCPGEAND